MTEPPIFEPDMPAPPAVFAAQGANVQAAGRDLFRYVVTPEWADYRAIMGVFADTFFSEFTPEDVAARLADAGHMLETVIVGERLDSLRRWGNLTVSSAVGNPPKHSGLLQAPQPVSDHPCWARGQPAR